MAENNEAAPESVRGDYSIGELRGMLRGDEPKPAAGEPKDKETPAAGGEQPAAGTEPNSGTDGKQAGEADGKPRGTDGKFKAKDENAGEPGDDKGEKESGEVPAGVQKRIDKAVRAQRDAERRADEAERKLTESQVSRPGDGKEKPEAKPAQSAGDKAESAPTRPKPEPAKFETYEAYIEDLTKWTIEQERAADQRSQSQRSRQDAEKETLRKHQERVAKAKAATLKDFDEVMEGAKDLPITRDMHTAIVTSEQGPELAYHLAKHPDEVKRIAALPPIRQIAELGKIEAALEAAARPAEKKPPAAEKKPLPKPAAPMGGGSGSAKEQKIDDPDIDMGTFKRLARAHFKKTA
jgi:hypothetical protein